MRWSSVHLGSMVVLVVGLASCSQFGSSNPSESDYRVARARLGGSAGLVPSGFLRDYSHLLPTQNAAAQGAFTYINHNVDFAPYSLLMIEPVEVYLNKEVAAQRTSASSLDQLGGYLDDELRKTLGFVFPIVKKPAFGVLRVRVAITDVKPDWPSIPSGIEEMKLSGGTIEAEIVDSRTGEQVVAFLDPFEKKSLSAKLGITNSTPVKEVLHRWVFLLRDTLDVARGFHSGASLTGTGQPTSAQ